MSPELLQQQIVNAIVLGAMYSLFAMGYALVFSVLGVLNLAHSAVFMWGAMFGLLAVTRLNVSIWLAIPLAMLGGGLLGVILDFVAFRPLRRRNAPRISQLISSLGASTLLVSLAQWQVGSEPQSFPPGTFSTTPFQGLPFRISPVQVVILVISLILLFVLRILVLQTRTGQAMRAVAFNARTARLLGINVGWIFANTFFLAGALAAVAGVFYGLNYQNSILYRMGEGIALKGLTVIVLGGLGNIPGAVLGGFVVAAIEGISISIGGSSYRELIVFLLLFLTLLVRPQGLMGQKEESRA